VRCRSRCRALYSYHEAEKGEGDVERRGVERVDEVHHSWRRSVAHRREGERARRVSEPERRRLWRMARGISVSVTERM
jgi:hypothetical protein